MKITTLTDRAMSVASKIYFNERKLREIAYTSEREWTKKGSTDKEEFEKSVKSNKQLYKKLREYREQIFNKCVIEKEITKEYHHLVNDKIKCLIDGTYKEKYC